jgi:hypothetical protein
MRVVKPVLLAAALGIAFATFPASVGGQSGTGDPAVLALMERINAQLDRAGLNIAVEQIEFFTFGQARPSNRIHQQPFRWVAGDPRRLASGDNITYLVDQSDGATSSGLTSAQTEQAIDLAFATSSSGPTPEPIRTSLIRSSGDSAEREIPSLLTS